MSKPSRAVYIPPAKRKRPTQQRFHGAFTGGFSAGFFNTVNTKEGWQPSTEHRREQRLEDFMDDQDHEEWGGPTKVRQEYMVSMEKNLASEAPLKSLFDDISRPVAIGPRLLRRLGWREGAGVAYVPTTEPDNIGSNKDEESMSKIHLSKRRLRQIQMQSSRIQLPPPKLDHCGLGFEALENAPEFKEHLARRQERAKLRARGQSNIYRISDAIGASNDTGQQLLLSSSDYISHETAEDFVGTHASSGFALRDDEDDVYDRLTLGGDRNTQKPTAQEKLLSQGYNAEIIDSDVDSDVDDMGTNLHGGPPKGRTKPPEHALQIKSLLGGALASWASVQPSALTSSGKPPLPGFRLGGLMESHKKRYPGPDLPRDYRPKRHVFDPNDRPAVFQAIGRALQLEGQEKHHETTGVQQQPSQTTVKPQSLLADPKFATLAAAMKNRFTSGTLSETSASSMAPTTLRPGLYQPPPIQAKEHNQPTSIEKPPSSPTKPKQITVRRVTSAFVPHPLLCKRLGVEVPRTRTLASDSNVAGRTTEATFFETEVLPSAREGALLRDKGTSNVPSTQEEDTKFDNVEEQIFPLDEASSRPSREKLKAIFEAESDHGSTTSDDTDLDSIDSRKEGVSHKSEDPKDIVPSKDSAQVVVYSSTEGNGAGTGQSDKVTECQEREILAASKSEVSDGGNRSSSDSDDEPSYRRRHRKKSDKKRKSSHKKRKRHKEHRRDDESSDADSHESGDRKGKRRDKDRSDNKQSRKRLKKHSKKSDRK